MSELDRLQEWSAQDWRRKATTLAYDGRLVIDGKRCNAAEAGLIDSINPATGNAVGQVAQAAEADVDRAVASAKAAFQSGVWSRMAPRERAATLYRFADLIEAHAAEISLYDTLEMGKPIADMVTVDVPEAVKTIRYFGEAIDKVTGTTTATESDVLHYTLRQPLGVVGAISPWNYPLLMAVWKIAPALAAGNSVVLKPSEDASLSCLMLGDLFLAAGGPAGVLNVLSGYGGEAGKALCLHMDVSKISFTGSTAVGKLIMGYSGASNLKKVGLECGGKSPQIFCADLPDMDQAVTAAINGIFANMGEVCNAGSRLLVAREIYDGFMDRFADLAQGAYKAGDPLDPSTTLGPLVNKTAQDRVTSMIAQARAEGARVLFEEETAGNKAGCYVSPVAFADVTRDMTIARKEVFGPVGRHYAL